MEKFKPGDKVMILSLSNNKNYFNLKVGDILTVKNSWYHNIYSFKENGCNLHGSRLELVERPFTQKDLEVGMLCESYSLFSEVNIINIDNLKKHKNVIKIYKPTETGFELVWEREKEKLYYLVLPGKVDGDRYYNQIRRVNKPSYNFSTKHQSIEFKTKFTAEEIKYLPNQNLIACLEQEDVNE